MVFECNSTFFSHKENLEMHGFLTIAEEIKANVGSKHCTDAIRRISFQNAMYPFQEHKIICCNLLNILNVFQVSNLIAKYCREGNNFTFNNNMEGFILMPSIIPGEKRFSKISYIET